jgi:hypothetical protein
MSTDNKLGPNFVPDPDVTCPKGNANWPIILLDEMDSVHPAVISDGDLLATMLRREREGGRSESRIKRAFIRYLEELGKQASSHPFF